MCEVKLPPTLEPLFPGLPRKVDVEATTVDGALDELERRWPGLKDRLCHPGPELRQHIHVYVNSERAELDTKLEPSSRLHVVAAITGG